jgi:hypothetical protein
MNRLTKTSFGVLFLASLGSLIADAHVYFPEYQEYIAGTGITIGLVLSIIGLKLYLNGK